LEYTEKSPPLSVTDSLTIRDVDNLTLRRASVSISQNYVAGEDILSLGSASGMSGSWDQQAGVLTLSGEASIDSYQAAIRGVTYTNTARRRTTLPRSISVEVNDGVDGSNVVTRSITIIQLSAPPTLSNIESAALAYTVKQDEVQITSTLTVQDLDSPELLSGEVAISGNYVSGEDTLLYNTQNGITGSWESASGTLRLSGKATSGAYESAFRSVRYLNTSASPAARPRQVSFAVYDGEATSAAVTRTVGISGTNDAPVLSGIEAGVLRYTPGSGPVIVSAGITAADPDHKNLQRAEVKFIQGFIPDEDSLFIAPRSSVSAQYDAKAGVLTISGQDLVSSYSSVLQSVQYRNNKGGNASKSLKRISFTVWDGVIWSGEATRDIDVDGIVSSVEAISEEIPRDFVLRQNYPNPFNPTTAIHFGVPVESEVTLIVYDMQGRSLKTLVQRRLMAGSYRTMWKAVNLSSGVYYCRMVAVAVGSDRRFVETKKLILLK
jgi:hypothetical protein